MHNVIITNSYAQLACWGLSGWNIMRPLIKPTQTCEKACSHIQTRMKKQHIHITSMQHLQITNTNDYMPDTTFRSTTGVDAELDTYFELDRYFEELTIKHLHKAKIL